jgi:hypothetical protein
MIWITDFGKNDIIFQFLDRELPESIPTPVKAILNKIQFPGGHQTNQVMGVYRGEVEWSGLFYGLYHFGGAPVSAKDRADQLAELVGKPLRFGFPVPGHGSVPGTVPQASLPKLDTDIQGGFKGVYIIEEFTPVVHNYLHVEYTIKLVPHERQEKIRPNETSKVRVGVVSANLSGGVTGLRRAAGKSKKGTVATKGGAVSVKNANTAAAMEGKRPEMNLILQENK